MTILHPEPLGASTRTELVTVPGDAYVDMERGDDGHPYLAVRNRAGDVLQVIRIGDADPADQREMALGFSAAFEEAAGEFAELETRAGADRQRGERRYLA